MKKMIIKCPTCEAEHNYYQSKPWSPFCSERCQLIDLGAWAGEEHRIKGEPVSNSDLSISDLSCKETDTDHSGGFVN